MARPKKDATTPAAPAEGTNGAAVEKSMSQREAVRLALRVKGKNAPNDVLLGYIRDEFGMALKKQSFATLKSQIKHEGRRGPNPTAKGGAGYTIEDLRLVQDLVARIGAARVRDMVDLFGK